MTITLDDAWAKLGWASKHYERLRPDIEAFEKRDAHTVSVDIDADAGKYTFYVHGLELTDPDWGLLIGDCLHNARCALDHLMVALVAFIRGQKPRDVSSIQFPVYSDPGKYKAAVADLAKEALFSGYLARVEELQPFNNGNPSVWGFQNYGNTSIWPLGGPPNSSPLPIALERLSLLDNIDKHRVIHAVWLGGAVDFKNLSTFPGIPADFQPKGATRGFGPLEDGAEIGSLEFETPLPHEWHPSEMDMKRYFRLKVSLDETSPLNGVLEVLPLCLWGAGAVLTLFGPVFAHGEPPLPATAVGIPAT